MTIQVKYAEAEVERNEIYRLRHEIYIEELGDREKHRDGYLTDEIDKQARLLYGARWRHTCGDTSYQLGR